MNYVMYRKDERDFTYKKQMGSRDVLHRWPDAGADAFHGSVLLRDSRPAGLTGAGMEMGAHLRRDGVALRLAIYDLSVDEAAHNVVDGAD